MRESQVCGLDVCESWQVLLSPALGTTPAPVLPAGGPGLCTPFLTWEGVIPFKEGC